MCTPAERYSGNQDWGHGYGCARVRPSVLAHSVLPVTDGNAILVVDDDRDAREMLSEYLTWRGYTVCTASDGIEAIEVAIRVRPRVVLMDLMMPRLDGWEATRRLRKDARTRQAHIIVVSARVTDRELEGAKNAGADEFLPKPCDLDHLCAIVQTIMNVSPASTPTEPSLVRR